MTRISIAAALLGAMVLTLSGVPVSASEKTDAAAGKPGKVVGRADCGGKYPAKGKLAGAFLHIWNNTCWSCPKGYSRSINPDVASGGACVKHGAWVHARATKHDKATGLLKTDCPRGSRQFWHIGDGYCYSCPRGYIRTLAAITSPKACLAKNRTLWAKGTKRGTPGCPKGAASVLDGRCIECPDGYWVPGGARYAAKLDVRTACKRIPPKPTAGLSTQQMAKVDRTLKQYRPLIEQAVGVARNMAKHDEEVRGYMRAKKPLPAALRAKIGLSAIEVEAADANLQTFTFAHIFDASILMGGSTANGVVYALDGSVAPREFTASTWSICCSLGVDGGLELGFWHPRASDMAGDSQGVVLSLSIYGGAAVTLIYGYCAGDSIGCFAEFQGFTVVPQIGFSAEVEYVRGTTWLR